MMNILKALWYKRRDIVSDGYDESLRYLSEILPVKTHEYPTGSMCWTWTIPEKWTLSDAYIEDVNGKKVYDAMQHPLCVVSYSLPVDKIVSCDELNMHLYSELKRPDAIPFCYKYYDRDWGFCIRHNDRLKLTADKYHVVIRSEFTKGTLKVGEYILQGKRDDIIVIASHLCHPAMANDDLSGIAVMYDLANAMTKIGGYNYTYIFLTVPETIGSIAYLANNESLIPRIKYGIFLEMLGNDNVMALQHSNKGDTKIDRMAAYILRKHCDKFREGAFRTIVGNDEMVFESPGVGISMISISRAPYPEYHTSDDDLSIISEDKLQEAKGIMLDIINAIDKDYIPERKFKGPVFLSGHGLWVDPMESWELNHNINQIMLKMDGDTSIFSIADELGLDYQEVFNYVERFYAKGLINKLPPKA